MKKTLQNKSKWNSRKLIFASSLIVLFTFLLSIDKLDSTSYVTLSISVMGFYFTGKAAECFINKDKAIDA